MKYELILPPNYNPPLLPGRDKWIAALRSGKYKQGRDALEVDGCHCCLGVLSHIQGRLKDECDGDEYTALSQDNPLVRGGYLSNNGAFPNGVEVKTTSTLHGHIKTSLIECNDAGLTFKQIADIIERVWSDGGPPPSNNNPAPQTQEEQGSWFVHGHSNDHLVIATQVRSDKHLTLKTVAFLPIEEGVYEKARIIIASRDLLMACEKLLWAETTAASSEDRANARKFAREAITKAKES